MKQATAPMPSREVEPTKPIQCDSCKNYFDQWLNFFKHLNLYICEECIFDAQLERNSLRFGLKNEP